VATSLAAPVRRIEPVNDQDRATIGRFAKKTLNFHEINLRSA
jgi:hypothetical protein